MNQQLAHFCATRLHSAAKAYRNAEKDALRYPRYRTKYKKDAAWQSAKAGYNALAVAEWAIQNPKVETEWKENAIALATLWFDMRLAWNAAKATGWKDQARIAELRERESALDAFLEQKNEL